MSFCQTCGAAFADGGACPTCFSVSPGHECAGRRRRSAGQYSRGACLTGRHCYGDTVSGHRSLQDRSLCSFSSAHEGSV